MSEPTKLSAFGASLELPLPKWAVIVLVTAALGGGGAIWFFTRDDAHTLITLKQANDALTGQLTEYAKHAGDDPEHVTPIFDDTRGKLSVKSFADGCVVLRRVSPKGERSKLVLDLARDEPVTQAETAWVTPVFAQASCNPRCPPGHPGAFRTEFRNQQGCLVEYWQFFQDGCVSWTAFNACAQVFLGTPCFVDCRH